MEVPFWIALARAPFAALRHAPQSLATLGFLRWMVRTESLGNFPSHQLGSFQDLNINATCDTSWSQRRGKKKAAWSGELSGSVIILTTLATIYWAFLSLDTVDLPLTQPGSCVSALYLAVQETSIHLCCLNILSSLPLFLQNAKASLLKPWPFRALVFSAVGRWKLPPVFPHSCLCSSLLFKNVRALVYPPYQKTQNADS